MAVEAKRGCGYRKVGGLYLVGDGLTFGCDRLPLAIEACPTCGGEPKANRGIYKIDPMVLWGPQLTMVNVDQGVLCNDPLGEVICHPKAAALDAPDFLMWVGNDYTVESFIAEAQSMGISKRLSTVPNDLKIGESWVVLAKDKIIPGAGSSWKSGEAEGKRGFGPGIFYAFRPQALEMIITESQDAAGKGAELREQEITPVVVPDNDPDHQARPKKQHEEPKGFLQRLGAGIGLGG